MNTVPPSFRSPKQPLSGDAFKRFYIASVIKTFENNRPHPTLGANIRDKSEERGKNAIRKLSSSHSILPNDTVVDYGCGTLRLGKHFIDYLDPNRYVGVEIDSRILDFGKNLLNESQLAKNPLLEVISPTSIKMIARLNPRWVFSMGVLHHIPPEDLGEYFGYIAQLIHSEGSQAFVRHFLRDATKQISSMSWEFDIDTLNDAIRSCGMILHPVDTPRPNMSTLLRLTRAQ